MLFAPESLAALSRPLVIAHRGASLEQPENTAAAIERAVELGADAVEVDLRRTADGALIIHHDPAIRRRGPLLRRQSLDDARAMAAAVGRPLLTLDELLSLIDGRVGLDLELKESGYEREVVTACSRFGLRDQLLITSFLDSALIGVKRWDASLRTGLLIAVTPATRLRDQRRPVRLLNRLHRTQADVILPHYSLLRLGIGRWRRYHRPLIVWTVNRARTMARLAPHVTGLISDDPDLARVVTASRIQSEVNELL